LDINYNKIQSTVNTRFVVCSGESLSEILDDFLNELEKESRIEVTQLNIHFDISKSYYIKDC